MFSHSTHDIDSQRISDLRSTAEFIELRRNSRRFTFIAGAVLLGWCLLLLWAVGYASEVMNFQVIGQVNVGFFFVWSQVVATVIVAGMFTKQLKSNRNLISKMLVTEEEEK